jgi:hypothetical protein
VDASVLAGHENVEVAAYNVDQPVAQHLLSRFVEGVDLASLIDDDARHRQTIHHLPDYTKLLAISTNRAKKKYVGEGSGYLSLLLQDGLGPLDRLLDVPNDAGEQSSAS